MESFEEQPKKNKWIKPVLIGTLITGGIVAATVCAIQFQHSETTNEITNRSSKTSTILKRISTKEDFYKELSIVFEKSSKQLKDNLNNSKYNWGNFKQQVLDVNGNVLTGHTKLEVSSPSKIKEAIKEIEDFLVSKDKENFKFKNIFYKEALKKAQAKMLELNLT